MHLQFAFSQIQTLTYIHHHIREKYDEIRELLKLQSPRILPIFRGV